VNPKEMLVTNKFQSNYGYTYSELARSQECIGSLVRINWILSPLHPKTLYTPYINHWQHPLLILRRKFRFEHLKLQRKLQLKITLSPFTRPTDICC